MKRIVICADGTWNTRDQIDEQTGKRRPTNVTKVARAIVPQTRDDGIHQIVYYHDGIGTRGPLDKFTGGAFGEGMGRNIQELYRFLVYNYDPGDEIFLFGFSRGAFTVRSMVGFMNKVGLVQKEDDYFVPDLYACYEKNKGPESEEWKRIFRYIKDPRPSPPVQFIGVWDTVGALGAPGIIGQLLNKHKYKFHDVELNDHIENAVQALAIDERRRPFKPSVWKRYEGWKGELVQAWFAGVHSNVGGGYDPDGLANEALHWIVEKAEELGLEFNKKEYLEYFTPCFNSVLQDSMTWWYWLLWPFTREIGKHPEDGESVHRSAIDRVKHADCDYHPQNLEKCLNKDLVPKHPKKLPIVDTTIIPRGKPCP